MLANVNRISLQYADDSSVICSGNSQDELNDTLTDACQSITNWLFKWRLKANCTKTDAITFKGIPIQLKISDERINISSETKVLGLVVDRGLKFKQQKDLASATLSKSWALLRPYIHHGLAPRVSEKILTSVILPKASHLS